MSQMEIVFLGTASAYPTPSRGVSCIGLLYGGEWWLFDCGEGSQIQVMKSQIKPGKISKIFISHLHGDHVFGLPGLICTISQSNQRNDPVEIYGPKGLRRFLRTSLELSRSELGFQYKVIEFNINEKQYPDGWQQWEVDHTSNEKLHPNEIGVENIDHDDNEIWNLCTDKDSLMVKAAWLKHRVPSFGFVIEEPNIPGKLDAELLKSRGVPPGPLYGQLKQGINITLPSGEEVKAEEVVGPTRKGRKVIICGDSCDSTQLHKIGTGADVLVHEATLENSMKENALLKGHSTPEMTAQLAVDLNAGRLILTHFSQRYQPLSCVTKENEDSVQKLLTEAEQTSSGRVRIDCAEDLKTFAIQIPR